jgi:hypothetical protein
VLILLLIFVLYRPAFMLYRWIAQKIRSLKVTVTIERRPIDAHARAVPP